MVIKEIYIENFRSIIKEKITTKNLNVFVGLNDIGKSNLLKALNLFFNSEAELGIQFLFDDNYCNFAPIRPKKAKEIKMILIIEPPQNYSKAEPIVWTKIWRKENPLKEIKFYSTNNY